MSELGTPQPSEAEQPALGSREALTQAIDEARQATQAAHAAGVPNVSYLKDTSPLIAADDSRESMQAGEIYGWNSPALSVTHSIGRTTAIRAMTSFVDKERGWIVDYELHDRHNPATEEVLRQRKPNSEIGREVARSRPAPRPVGKIKRTDGNGEVLNEHDIYRPETARRLATTIAKQVTRRAQEAHSAHLAPKRAPHRSQFS